MHVGVGVLRNNVITLLSIFSCKNLGFDEVLICTLSEEGEVSGLFDLTVPMKSLIQMYLRNQFFIVPANPNT